MKSSRSLLAVLFVLSLMSPPTPADEPTVRIGAGGGSGTFQPVAEALCRLLSANGIPCEALATEGSVDNLARIRAGAIELALVQADTQFLAYKGGDGAVGSSIDVNKRLRALFSLYDEPYTLVVKRGIGIRKLQDIKGKRVNLGAPKSGERETNRKLMDRMGWRESDFARIAEENYEGHQKLFCGGEIDAIPILIGHPNRAVGELLSRCDGELMPVVSLSVHTLVKEYPYFTDSKIHAGVYPEVKKDVPTFGVKATLVTSSDVEEALAYEVTRIVFSNLDAFKASHPALQWLDPKEMVKGNSAPFHNGAARYYREAGMLAP